MKTPDDVERLFSELTAYMRAKDEKGVRRVFRELLDTGRSRQEIVSEVIRLLDNKAPTTDQLSNGTDQRRLTEARAPVGHSPAERYHHPTGWPDIAPQFSANATDRTSFAPLSAQVPPEPSLEQEPRRDPQKAPSAAQKPVRASESGPDLVAEPNSNHEGPAEAQASKSARGPSVTKKEGEPYPPVVESEVSGRGHTKKSRRPSLAKDKAETSDSWPEATPARAQASSSSPRPTLPRNGAQHVLAPGNNEFAAGEASKSTSASNLGKNGVGGCVPTAPFEPSKAHGHEKVADERQDVAAAETNMTLDSSVEPVLSVFANTSSREVGGRADGTRESVAERLAAKLHPTAGINSDASGTTNEAAAPQTTEDAAADWSRLASGLLQSSGISSALPGTMKKAVGAHTDALANWSESPKAHWRLSRTAVRLLTVAPLLVAAIGGAYVVWDFYGIELEQAGLASARSARTWLQDVRSSGLLLKPEAAPTVGKTVDSQQTEAAVVTNLPQNARTDETTSSQVAALTAEGSAPKPPESMIEPKGAPQPLDNLEPPATSSTRELSPIATKRDELNTKTEPARPKGISKNAALSEIPPRKPTPPDASLSSGTVPQSVMSKDSSGGAQSPPVSAALQAASPIDAAALVTRGDQFLGMRDVAAARLFYQRAADAGNREGALRMGMTFDPLFLERSGLRGVRGDPGQAAGWYDRAAALGNKTAEPFAERAEGTVR